MLITIKPHSSLRPYFSAEELEVDIDSLTDIPRYLNTMQPKFYNYVRQQKSNNLEEGYVFLDKNLRELSYDDLLIKHVRTGDVIHIVPAIFGGGGKRGGLLAVFALVAFFAFFPIGAAGAAGAAGAGGAGAAGAAATSTAGGALGKGLLAKLPSFLQSIVINAGLALLSSLFTKKEEADKASRQNDMFGSLKNSTSSDTPVALHYGQVRVAGQLISGYIQTINNAKNETVSVAGVIDGLTYGGAGQGVAGKGLGSFLLSTSTLFDTEAIQNISDSSVYSAYVDPSRVYGLFAFSDSESSLTSYKVYGDVLTGFSTDGIFLSEVKSPVAYSASGATDPNYIFSVSPTSNALVASLVTSDVASVSGVYTDDNNLPGAIDLALDTSDNLAYVAAPSSNTISSVSIANPYAMSLVNSYSDNDILASVEHIAVNTLNKLVFTVSGSTISVFRSSEGLLSLVSSLTDSTNLLDIADVAVDELNNLLIVASRGTNKIRMIDTSDPANLVLISNSIDRADVSGIALITLESKTKIASISDSSATIVVNDLIQETYNILGSFSTNVSNFLFSNTSISTSAVCASISSLENNIVVTMPSINAISVYKYTETVTEQEDSNGRNQTITNKELLPIYYKQDNEFLVGASSAVITGG